MYRTGSIVQHNGIRISSVLLLVINPLSLVVSLIKVSASHSSNKRAETPESLAITSFTLPKDVQICASPSPTKVSAGRYLDY